VLLVRKMLFSFVLLSIHMQLLPVLLLHHQVLLLVLLPLVLLPLRLRLLHQELLLSIVVLQLLELQLWLLPVLRFFLLQLVLLLPPRRLLLHRRCLPLRMLRVLVASNCRPVPAGPHGGLAGGPIEGSVLCLVKTCRAGKDSTRH
jgi:hypothetical protein